MTGKCSVLDFDSLECSKKYFKLYSKELKIRVAFKRLNNLTNRSNKNSKKY